jgi:hypothetical protein
VGPAGFLRATSKTCAVSDSLPEFPFDASPRTDRCERCAAGQDHDLRFMIVRGRTRYLGRTLCDTCAEEVLEAMISADSDADSRDS